MVVYGINNNSGNGGSCIIDYNSTNKNIRGYSRNTIDWKMLEIKPSNDWITLNYNDTNWIIPTDYGIIYSSQLNSSFKFSNNWPNDSISHWIWSQDIL